MKNVIWFLFALELLVSLCGHTVASDWICINRWLKMTSYHFRMMFQKCVEPSITGVLWISLKLVFRVTCIRQISMPLIRCSRHHLTTRSANMIQMAIGRHISIGADFWFFFPIPLSVHAPIIAIINPNTEKRGRIYLKYGEMIKIRSNLIRPLAQYIDNLVWAIWEWRWAPAQRSPSSVKRNAMNVALW